jgi:rod shape-determining protein MreC
MALYSMGRRRIIVLLVLTSILLITLDTRGNAVIDRARSVLSLAISPFDAAARTISRPVINAWNGIANYDELRRENEALRAEIDTQRGAEIEARAAINEYQELLTLNRLLGSGSYPTVTAQVQGARPSNFQYTVEINRGSTDGIEVGMPVVNGAGLVGKISRVFPNSSIVLLVIDPSFSIGAKVLTADPATTSTTAAPGLRPTEAGVDTTTATTVGTVTEETAAVPVGPLAPFDPSATTTVPVPTTTTPEAGGTTAAVTTTTTAPVTTVSPGAVIRETGTLSGQGPDRPMVLRFIDDSATLGRVRVGSPVQTAGGLRSIAPPGIPIGEVSAISEQPGTRALKVEVSISAGDLSKLNFVQVLRYSPTTSGG